MLILPVKIKPLSLRILTVVSAFNKETLYLILIVLLSISLISKLIKLVNGKCNSHLVIL